MPDALSPPHGFWQTLLAPDAIDPQQAAGPFTDTYPARLPDGRWLMLPLRVLPGTPDRAVASLIVNQAALAVEDALIAAMAGRAAGIQADIVVALPTLGLTLGRGVAHRLGHSRYVPLGHSRKFWYRDELSVPTRSITSPGRDKRLYLDPRLVPLVDGRRVLIVDDVVSTGGSARAALDLLLRAGARPVGLIVAMVQTDRWRPTLNDAVPGFSNRVAGVFQTPLFAGGDGAWSPISSE